MTFFSCVILRGLGRRGLISWLSVVARSWWQISCRRQSAAWQLGLWVSRLTRWNYDPRVLGLEVLEVPEAWHLLNGFDLHLWVFFVGTFGMWVDVRFYNSRSLNQKMVAVVEGITSDGHYDLDVKKSADPKNLSPYVAPWLNLRAWQYGDASFAMTQIRIPAFKGYLWYRIFFYTQYFARIKPSILHFLKVSYSKVALGLSDLVSNEGRVGVWCAKRMRTSCVLSRCMTLVRPTCKTLQMRVLAKAINHPIHQPWSHFTSQIPVIGVYRYTQ